MIRRLVLLSIVATGAMSAPVVPRAETSQPAVAPRVVLGVLRADGVLLPFAAYDGKKWSAPWGGKIDRGMSPVLPATLDAVPADWWGGEAPVSWKLWTMNDAASRPFKLVAPAMVPVGATRQLGIRTDVAPTAAVPPFELPYPKAGLAVSGDAAIKPIAIVSRLSPAFKQFSALLRSEVITAEERTLSALRSNSNWKPPFDKKMRATVEPELEAWYVTATEDGERMSYVEAAKKYPLVAEDKGCGLETFVSGWVHQPGDPNAKPKMNLKAVVTYCDRRDVSYMLPFGAITLRDKIYWILQMSGQDHEWYAVVESNPGRAKYVAEYQAGAMPTLPR
jgi:hypothetical protein